MRRHDDRGAVAVEFGLLLPVLMMVIWGIIEFGLAIHSTLVLTNAAREAARTVAISGDPTKAAGAVTSVADTEGAVSVNVYQRLTSASSPTALSSGACTNGAMVSVLVSKPYTVVIPFVPNISMTLSGKGAMRCGG